MGLQERQSKIDEQKAQFTNLYVKNVDPEVTQDEFMELFLKFGIVTSAVIQFDDEGISKGFGFVNYEDHEAAQLAVDELHDTELKGKKLFVSRAQKKAEREEELRRSYEQVKMEKLSKYQGVNLYIKNLEDDVDDEKLRGEFEPFGAVTSCKVMRDDKGTSKGFGFVCFSSPDEATKAVAEMNNKMIGTKPLYVSLAQRREVRRQQLESQIAQRNQIRMQQAAVAGLPGAYINGPLYYPPGPGGFPQRPSSGRSRHANGLWTTWNDAASTSLPSWRPDANPRTLWPSSAAGLLRVPSRCSSRSWRAWRTRIVSYRPHCSHASRQRPCTSQWRCATSGTSAGRPH